MTPELEAQIRDYWARGLRDKEIHEVLLAKHIDTTKYSLRWGFLLASYLLLV